MHDILNCTDIVWQYSFSEISKFAISALSMASTKLVFAGLSLPLQLMQNIKMLIGEQHKPRPTFFIYFYFRPASQTTLTCEIKIRASL